MKETVSVTDHHPIPWTTKINPIWWLQGDDGWTVPEINNGAPYLPDINNSFLRRVIWFGFRNPLMNFVGYIIGVEDRNYTVTGDAPALATTGKDCTPVQEGWRTAWINLTIPLPFVSYYKKGVIEFYLGWRPASGGFGLKIVKG
jgi:hypothetical protein